jgi:hypothetical protein
MEHGLSPAKPMGSSPNGWVATQETMMLPTKNAGFRWFQQEQKS